MKTLVTTGAGCLQSRWAGVVLSAVPVCTSRTPEKKRKGSSFCLGSVHQTCAAVVCNPIGASPSEGALFLVTVHLFGSGCSSWEKNGETPIPDAWGGLGLFLEAFDGDESVLFPLAVRNSGSNFNKLRIYETRCRCICPMQINDEWYPSMWFFLWLGYFGLNIFFKKTGWNLAKCRNFGLWGTQVMCCHHGSQLDVKKSKLHWGVLRCIRNTKSPFFHLKRHP